MKTQNADKTLKSLSSVEVLRKAFLDRKERNAHYSLNAFARDLDLSSSLLSRILSGSRSLTLKQAMHIAAMLSFTQNETNRFILSVVETASKTAKISKRVRDQIQKQAEGNAAEELKPESPLYVNYDVERFKTISQWYHLAILNLTFVEGFESDSKWIASRLGISSQEAASAVSRLLELGMLEQSDAGRLTKTKANLYFKTDRSEAAIRSFHSQMIDKAKEELAKTEAEDFSRRLISGITFSCAPEHIELLKNKIDQFQDEVLALTKEGTSHEVYQMNTQLIPLTKNRTKKKTGEMK